jgi:hypothetical protein
MPVLALDFFSGKMFLAHRKKRTSKGTQVTTRLIVADITPFEFRTATG